MFFENIATIAAHSDFEIEFERLELLEEIGKGAFGKVKIIYFLKNSFFFPTFLLHLKRFTKLY